MAPKKQIPKVNIKSTTTTTSTTLNNNKILPTKEAALFRQVLQQYESKEWRKGIKTAETILKTYPDHGETLAMKGLFLSCIDRKVEGYEFVKRGVRQDIGSHIVWHVYGIMHRADKNFEEALKCYTQANRLEKDSPNIIGDLALLTIHLRNYPAYVEARQAILRTGPRLRRNWIALAVAQHLAEQYFESDRTLTSYEGMLREMPEKEFEHSEVLLYHALVLEEAGEFEKCLEFLGEHAGSIVDRLAYSVQRAHLLLKLGRTEPAEWAWELLLEENPDSYEYIKAYVRAKGADVDSKTEEGRIAAAKVLDVLSEKYPRSLAVRRIALELVTGEEFKTKVSKYLIDALSKGVPSIFADVKSLYSNPEKRIIIGELVETYRNSLESSDTFGVKITDDSDDETVESSSAYLWTLYFLSQHYSTLTQHTLALSTLALAESHTPSLPELSMLKARILKRAGDPQAALKAMTQARELDGQDRFLNSKEAKYLIRAEENVKAEAMVGLFTKKDAPSPLEDLVEMQCLWFLHEQGDSYLRQEKFALALKRYHQIFDIFTEVEEDQYDFHGYCLRKYTLRAYINLLRYIDTLRSHPRYIGAAKGAIEVYLKLHDDPSSVLPLPLTNGAAEAASLEAAEKKKVEEAKIKKAAAEKLVVDTKGKKSANKKVEEEEIPAPIVDQDPVGEILLQTKEPLVQALKFLKPLEKAAPGIIDTWLLSFEVAIRREKYLQALKALRTAHSIDPSSPALHTLIIRLLHLVASLPSDYSPTILSTINISLVEITGGLSSSTLGSDYLQRNSGKPNCILAVAKGMLVDCGEDKEAVEGLLFELLRVEVAATLKCLIDAFGLLKSWNSKRSEEFRIAAKDRYPLARAFKSSEELILLEKKEVLQGDESKELVE